MRLLTEIGLVFSRQTALSLRSPAWIIIGLVQPVLYLALFGPLLGTVAEVASFPAGDSWQVFVPGLLVMQSLFSAAFVGFGVIAEQRNGVLERMRVTPVSRLALLLGRVFRDMLVLLAQSLVLLPTAFAFGLRAPVPGMLMGLGLLGMFGAGVSSLTYALGLRLRTPHPRARDADRAGTARPVGCRGLLPVLRTRATPGRRERPRPHRQLGHDARPVAFGRAAPLVLRARVAQRDRLRQPVPL